MKIYKAELGLRLFKASSVLLPIAIGVGIGVYAFSEPKIELVNIVLMSIFICWGLGAFHTYRKVLFSKTIMNDDKIIHYDGEGSQEILRPSNISEIQEFSHGHYGVKTNNQSSLDYSLTHHCYFELVCKNKSVIFCERSIEKINEFYEDLKKFSEAHQIAWTKLS